MHVWVDDRVFVSADRGNEYETRHSCRKRNPLRPRGGHRQQCRLTENAKKKKIEKDKTKRAKKRKKDSRENPTRRMEKNAAQ